MEIHRKPLRLWQNFAIKNLPGLQEAMEEWRVQNKTGRLWKHDATLWTGQDEAQWLGWLTVVEQQLEDVATLEQFSQEIRNDGFDHALLLGMGGSSLCAEVLASVYGKVLGFPQLLVLDSIDPAQVHRLASKLDLKKTLFIASSKSGTTLEVDILTAFFLDRMKRVEGDRAGARFIAVTDHGSPLYQCAKRENFRHVFAGVPSIGGRFSALSNFGLVPAAAMGLDVRTLLSHAAKMVAACRKKPAPENNPGVMLGLALGVASHLNRDKITIVTSPSLGKFGSWIEQLLAESTGKNGKGLFPVDREALSAPDVYGDDRVFCYIRDRNSPDSLQDEKIRRFERAAFPVVQIHVSDIYDLGKEFFRWEFATAVAGSVLGINPFNQPDVEASKTATRELLIKCDRKTGLPMERPIVEGDGLKLFVCLRNGIAEPSRGEEAIAAALRGHLQKLRPRDCFVLLAFLEMSDLHETILHEIRNTVRDVFRVATLVGFAPRYLHSTGQLFKGGPNTGVFIQVTSDPPMDLQVPGQKYMFSTVASAQALGDFRVMAERERRILRVHIGPDVASGLGRLCSEILTVLKRI